MSVNIKLCKYKTFILQGGGGSNFIFAYFAQKQRYKQKLLASISYERLVLEVNAQLALRLVSLLLAKIKFNSPFKIVL